MGVAMLEVMSEDLAHRIYMKLNKQKQATVRNFMKKFSYSSAKEERLLEAGEQLKMALFAESFGELRGQLDNAVAEAVIRITDKDLAEACLKVPKEALPRLLIYCEPKRIAKILEHLKRADAKQFEAVVASVIKIPEAKFQSNFDAVLVDRLKQVLSVSESDFQREYLDFYKEIIEESGDKLRGDVAEKLATQHPKIREFIDETIITINTLFKLDSEYQEDIIEYLSNKDIAALFTSLEADQKADLLVMVDERRRELLDDDVTRLNARGKKQIEAAFEQAKRLVIERILVLKGEGTIQELMSQPKNMQNNAA
jgi:Mg/Co/Ni transporter MgtE